MDMDTRMFLRLGAVALVAVSTAVAVVEFGGMDPFSHNLHWQAGSDKGRQTKDPRAEDRGAEDPRAGDLGVEDPLGPMLTRCVELGEVAIRDAGCRKTWMENRRRFLGAGPRMQDKPAQPQGAAGAPLPGSDKTGVADEDFPAGTDDKAAPQDANKNNLPNDAGKDAATPDAQPDSDPLNKLLTTDPAEAQ